MYKLCRIFVSDITAGENLLRNGYLPILRENQHADHGVLFAVNGTCKTTLISFILNVFCPDQRRFVQNLQSGGDKTLEQYLIPDRPAVILLELALFPRSDLFKSSSGDRLVLGQILYRRRSAQDKIDRTFFIANSSDFFDELRSNWNFLLRQDRPYDTLCDFMTPKVQQTHLQNDWTEKLEGLGLDPWLMDRQIDFARTEGGIKNSFKFRSEDEFLSFFLGCVTDMDAAANLRNAIGASLRKMKDRPQKTAQLRSARKLKGKMSDYDNIAGKWRQAQESVKAWSLQIGEAAHILKGADRTAERKKASVTADLQESEEERKNVRFQEETAEVNRLFVLCFQLDAEIQSAEKRIKEAEEEVTRLQGEETALEAAETLSEIYDKRAQVKNKKEALMQANTQLAPKLRRLDELVAQYHIRLDYERKRFEKEIDKLEHRRKETEKNAQIIEDRQNSEKSRQKNLTEKLTDITSDIRTAEAEQANLHSEPGENPLQTKKRLTEEVEEAREIISKNRIHSAALEKRIGDNDFRWQQLVKEQSDTAIHRDRAKEETEAEASERESLLADPNLQRIAGAAIFEPSSAGLVSRLDNAINRNQDGLEEKEQQLASLKNNWERLSQTETLAADEHVKRLITHYQQQGVSPGEIKSFPEYLADLYESPEEIAQFINGDPARFTGIWASAEEVIEKVCNLPVPDWLCKPVVISTFSTPEEFSPVDQSIIKPVDPRIYSKPHMESIKIRVQNEIGLLNRDIVAEKAALEKMKDSGRALHAYQEKYPDRFAAERLAQQVRKEEDALTSLLTDIGNNRESRENLQKQKGELEGRYQQLVPDLARHEEWLNQVENWLNQYNGLDLWQKEHEEIKDFLSELEKSLQSDSRSLDQLRKEIWEIQMEIQHWKNSLKNLEQQAADIPQPEKEFFSEETRKTALQHDLQSLRHLWGEAKEDQRQLASLLGVDALQRALDNLQTTIGQKETRLNAFRRNHPYDQILADEWASRSLSEREERKEKLKSVNEKRRMDIVSLEIGNQHKGRELQQLKTDLSNKAKEDIHPDISEDALIDTELDSLLHRLENKTTKYKKEHERLKIICRKLDHQLQSLEKWHQQIQLCMAEIYTFPPIWDNRSPRTQWPDMQSFSAPEEPMEAVKAFRNRIEEMIGFQQQDEKDLADFRKKMGSAFDRLQTGLRDESYERHLPKIVAELRGYDAESLGLQAKELISRCDDTARNLEGDLKRSEKILNTTVNCLVMRAKEYHGKLKTAAQERIPDNVPIYGGKSILRAGTALDFNKNDETFRNAVKNWLHDLIEKDRLPEVNPRVGNRLGTELLCQLLGSVSGKSEFGIRLLKCDDTGRKYEPVGKDMGSGGEALTTAVLLYSLLISMRKNRRSRQNDPLPAFLILDNPFGVCSRSDFVDAQLRVAGAMGIQCVYVTGINDVESLNLFELRMAVRKNHKRLEIDGTAYDCLEITEHNVEKRNGHHPS